MATRSRIAVEIEEGKVLSVYCHNDGYIDGVGAGMINRFPHGTETKDVLDYIQKGDRSTTSVSYNEWRGEVCPPRVHESVDKFFSSDIQEYGYLYTAEGQWLVKKAYGNDNRVKLLIDCL
jgi:hypothetical protein